MIENIADATMTKPRVQQPHRIILAIDPNGRVFMTRDMELIRQILKEIQSRKEIKPKIMQIEGLDDVIVGRHIELLFDAGLIEGISHRTVSKPYADIMIRDLSWEGHDFIAALDNDGVWAKIKQALSPNELATLPLSIVKQVGLKILEAYVMQKTGISNS